MAPEVLSSNIVNYLIWRYLQETGFAHAAWQLQQKWFRDPQKLPFAPRVRQHALVEMLSDGLYYDQLQSKHTGKSRRYEFGSDHGSRFPDPGFGPFDRTPRGVEARAASRKRRRDASSGFASADNERNHANRVRRGLHPMPRSADLMDVDPALSSVAPTPLGSAAPAVQPHEPENAVASEAESPVVEEPLLPAPTTLEIGTSSAMQSEPEEKDLLAKTSFLKVGDKATDISSTLWIPGDSTSLLVTGEHLIREYDFPSLSEIISPGDESPQSGSDVPLSHSRNPPAATLPQPSVKSDIVLPIRDTYNVTASVFTSPTSAVIALDQEDPAMSTRSPDSSPRLSDSAVTKLYSLSDSLQRPRFVSSLLGTAVQMRWNAASKRLLCLSATAGEESGCISIVSESTTPITPPATVDTGEALQNGIASHDDNAPDEPPTLGAVQSTNVHGAIFDAAWTGSDTFIVVGPGLVQEWQAASSEEGSMTLRNSFDTTYAWEKVRYDSATGTTALATAFGSDGGNFIGLLTTKQVNDQSGEVITGETRLLSHSYGDCDVCDIAFQPVPESALPTAPHEPHKPRILASCSDDGAIILWDVLKPFSRLAQLSTGSVPALALAWKPDGSLLAGGGLDEVSIWKIEPKLIERTDATSAISDIAVANRGSIEIIGRLWGRGKYSEELPAKTNGHTINNIDTDAMDTSGGTATSQNNALSTATQTELALRPSSARRDLKGIWEMHHDSEFELEHELIWDDLGRRLAFCVANQIAVIDVDSSSN